MARRMVGIEVVGRPGTFATKGEKAWRSAVAQAVATAMADPSVEPAASGAHFEIHFTFRTPVPLTQGDAWDIDNLVKPTMDAMAGVLGNRVWNGPEQAADHTVDRIEASKRTVEAAEDPGATIEVFEL